MPGSQRKSFSTVLFSTPVLAPIVLGVGAGVAITMFAEAHRQIGMFLAVFGALGSAGTLLTQLILSGPRVPPEVARKRQEVLRGLEDLADPGRYPASAESDRLASAAQMERP